MKNRGMPGQKTQADSGQVYAGRPGKGPARPDPTPKAQPPMDNARDWGQLAGQNYSHIYAPDLPPGGTNSQRQNRNNANFSEGARIARKKGYRP
jgi:hypothetical protein